MSRFKVGDKKSFRLFGTTWTISFVKKTESSKDKHWIFGNSSIADRLIQVSVNNKDGKLLDEETICTSALHEIVHSILTSGQYLDSTQDEPQVEWIARSIQSLYEQNVFQYILENKSKTKSNLNKNE